MMPENSTTDKIVASGEMPVGGALLAQGVTAGGYYARSLQVLHLRFFVFK